MLSRTFLNWYKRADYKAYAFNTRPVMRNPCQKPFIFYLSRVGMEASTNRTVSAYVRHRDFNLECKWMMADPRDFDRVEVYKKPDPHLWDRFSEEKLLPGVGIEEQKLGYRCGCLQGR
ncbi:hypothetical protein CASFOL_036817 [Castilleja foliolosa]|uniref:Uncharacterized protein n=1 Tax=Castilleja foliolosa TaxID=1961234 RepID=A0ABD3BRA9_9LAMI